MPYARPWAFVSGRSRRLTSTVRESEGKGRWLNRSVPSTLAGGRIARDGARIGAHEALIFDHEASEGVRVTTGGGLDQRREQRDDAVSARA